MSNLLHFIQPPGGPFSLADRRSKTYGRLLSKFSMVKRDFIRFLEIPYWLAQYNICTACHRPAHRSAAVIDSLLQA